MTAPPSDPPAEAAPQPSVDRPGAHPADPFEAEYRPLAERQVGIAAGQLRALGLAGFGYRREPHGAVKGVLELVTFPHLGVRGTAACSMPSGLSDPSIAALRTGPALHFLPYRSFDLGLYFEGGAGVLDPLRTRREIFFTIAPGISVDVALGSYWFLHVDVEVPMGVSTVNGVDRLAIPMGFIGFGPAL